METWAGGVAELPGASVVSEPSRSSVSTEVGAAAITFLALTVLGVAAGLLWSAAGPHVLVVITPNGPDLRPNGGDEFFAGEGAFGLIGIALGAVCALAVWFAARRWRGPVLIAALGLGCLAGAVVAWQVGRHLGLAHYRDLLHSTDVGRQFSRPVDVRSKGMLLLEPLTAVLTYVLLASWTLRPDLRRTSPHLTPPHLTPPHVTHQATANPPFS